MNSVSYVCTDHKYTWTMTDILAQITGTLEHIKEHNWINKKIQLNCDRYTCTDHRYTGMNHTFPGIMTVTFEQTTSDTL